MLFQFVFCGFITILILIMEKTSLSTLLLFILPFFLFAQNDTILVDFGNNQSPAPWNNFTNTSNGVLSGLVNTDGFATDIALTVIDSFNGINNSGTTMPNPALGIPATASGDSFYGNLVFFGGQTQPTAAVELSELDPEIPYTLNIFSSRVASDNRETRYVVIGNTVDTFYLDVASNTDSIVITTLLPATDGTIQVHATVGPNNTNDYGFYYLGAMKLVYESNTPVLSASLNLTSPDGGEYWQSGKDVSIRWESTNVGQALLEYSTDDGFSWNTINSIFANSQQYTWNVPNEVSTDCLVRISTDTLSDVSEGHFEITDDTTTCSIVVMGSSTAAGVGPSVADSAWVNRYYDVLYQRDTRFIVTNLARGGYTTFHLLPDDAVIPDNINVTIDSTRNISAALTYDPYAIIINLPSNDVANGFAVGQQIENFKQITNLAAEEGILSWVCTTQPRNFSQPLQIEAQENARDSIYAIYGDFAIDFWSEMADSNSMVASQFDSGDGVHLNDWGHRILTQRVLDKRIDTLCNATVISIDEPELAFDEDIKVFPNPFDDKIILEMDIQESGTLKLALYDMLGRFVASRKIAVQGTGTQQLEWEPYIPEQLNGQMLALRLQMERASNPFIKSFLLLRKGR